MTKAAKKKKFCVGLIRREVEPLVEIEKLESGRDLKCYLVELSFCWWGSWGPALRPCSPRSYLVPVNLFPCMGYRPMWFLAFVAINTYVHSSFLDLCIAVILFKDTETPTSYWFACKVRYSRRVELFQALTSSFI